MIFRVLTIVSTQGWPVHAAGEHNNPKAMYVRCELVPSTLGLALKSLFVGQLMQVYPPSSWQSLGALPACSTCFENARAWAIN
jgi:hypothetical protein